MPTRTEDIGDPPPAQFRGRTDQGTMVTLHHVVSSAQRIDQGIGEPLLTTGDPPPDLCRTDQGHALKKGNHGDVVKR